MSHCWREPIKLTRFWRFVIEAPKVLGPLTLAVISILLAKRTQYDDHFVIAAIAVFGVTAVTYIVSLVLSSYGNAEKAYVDALLNRLGNEVWDRPPAKLEGPVPRHRITLFQLVPRTRFAKWLQSDWTHRLVPRARIPAAGRRPRRVFLVHDHYEEHCEGVAGRAFCKVGEALVVPDLPNLHPEIELNAHSKRQLVDKYARRTFLDPRKIEQDLPYSRMIGGVCLILGGERWGVLVFDSVDPNALGPQHLSTHTPIKRLLGVLTLILEKGRL